MKYTAASDGMPDEKTRRSVLMPAAVAIILPPLLAFLAQRALQIGGGAPPPPGFGSGSMFDQIATRYDVINRVLAMGMDAGWRRRMVREVGERVAADPGLGPHGVVRLLDAATGTADVAIRLAEDIPSSTVLGVDPSENMLGVGRAKVRRAGLDRRIELVAGDARDLSPLSSRDGATRSFDGATMAFGIRNVHPGRDAALCEIHRLLRPGGVLAVLEFSEPEGFRHGVLGALARVFIRHVVPIVGGVLSGKPREYAHLQNSIGDFPSPPEFRSLMQGLSCGGEGEGGGGSGQGRGYFDVGDVVDMNFGSVQLYVGTAVKPSRKEQGVEA